jgi:hypothetical protein
MTPWAKTLVAAKATRRIADEYCILKTVWVILVRRTRIDYEMMVVELYDRLLAGYYDE